MQVVRPRRGINLVLQLVFVYISFLLLHWIFIAFSNQRGRIKDQILEATNLTLFPPTNPVITSYMSFHPKCKYRVIKIYTAN